MNKQQIQILIEKTRHEMSVLEMSFPYLPFEEWSPEQKESWEMWNVIREQHKSHVRAKRALKA